MRVEGEYEGQTEFRVSHRRRLCRNTSHDSRGISHRHAGTCENEHRGHVGDDAGWLEDGNVGSRAERRDRVSFGLCGCFLSFSPGPELREGPDLRANAMAGLTTGSSANDRGGCVQFSHGWGQGRRDVAVRPPDLRRVAGLLAGGAIERTSLAEPRTKQAA